MFSILPLLDNGVEFGEFSLLLAGLLDSLLLSRRAFNLLISMLGFEISFQKMVRKFCNNRFDQGDVCIIINQYTQQCSQYKAIFHDYTCKDIRTLL